MTRQLVKEIYEASLEPERWRSTLAAIAQESGGQGAHLLLWDEHGSTSPFCMYVGVDSPDAERLFAEYYGAIDPRRRYVMTRPVGEWMACHHVCDERFVQSSEFYQDYMIPTVGCRFMAGVRLSAEGGLHALLAVGRRADSRALPYEETELSVLRELTPHLQLAVRVQNRIGMLEDQLAVRDAALDRLSMAVLIVERDGLIRYSNAPGEAMLQSLTGPFNSNAGRLVCRSGRQGRRLEAAIRGAVDLGVGDAIAFGAGHADLNNCVVLPLSPRLKLTTPWQRPMVMLLCTGSGAGDLVDLKVLNALFNLTPAEARLAAGLGAGKTVEAFAVQTGISVLTARSQLRSVFSKVGVNRQADLVAILQRLSHVTPGSLDAGDCGACR
jgi:DNA-binding CsgD family transcriptional regulator